MTNPMYSSQPNYSGVTIQIANPAVYAGGGGIDRVNSYGVSQPQICPNNACYPQPQNPPAVYAQQEALPSYPPQYYLNNYNYQNNGTDARKNKEASPENGLAAAQTDSENAVKQYEPDIEEPQDFSKSKAVIDDLDARAAAEAEEKKNSKQKRVVALTDEYIKSLENYLNNPNDEIRLMASKEILTRLDEDKDRYNDAALNALLNKMLQDPSKLIRVAALSAFASQLASGNDYTITLLHNIQQNPSADKEDVLQAADILLKMSAGTEVKNIPNPAVKETPDNDEGQKQ
ncbi:unknown [Acinetobacter sp. CAG:196]|nr:unknown [Acinetobacter sp. CAG:196]